MQAWIIELYVLVIFLDKPGISKKTSVVTKIGRDCQQGWPPGAVSRVFCPQKRVGSTGDASAFERAHYVQALHTYRPG